MQADGVSRPAGPGHSASDPEFGVGVPKAALRAAADLGQSPPQWSK